MSGIDGILEHWNTVRAGARFALDLPKIVPFARMSPARVLRHWARKIPDNLALAYRDERYTWSELNDRANQYAAWLSAQGIGPGDVVALIMDNRPDFLFIVMALSKIGAVGSLINTHISGKELDHGLRVCEPKKLISGSEHSDRVAEVLRSSRPESWRRDLFVQDDAGSKPPKGFRVINAEVDAEPTREHDAGHVPRNGDVYCYIYTSGTTGLPKAAVIRNQRMIGANFVFGRLMHRSGPGDVIYVPLPLYHSSAMFLGWGAALATGAATALRRKFSVSDFWRDVREYRATSFLYIGETCRYLLNAPLQEGERDHELRVGVGNGMAPNIWEPFQERFAIPVIREFYGATEGNALLINFRGRPKMVGRVMRSQAVVKCDLTTGEALRNEKGFCERVEPGRTGLLVGRVWSLLKFDGYLDERATEEKILRNVFRRGDCYFNTGDLLTLHDGRWVSFADRIGDTFRWKGENVSTAEVAGVLGDAAGILEVNVYGVRVPHAEGRVGMAAITTCDDFDLDGFSDFVEGTLPSYQRPRFLRMLRGGMRVTGTFKHQKCDYREEGFDPKAIDDPLYLLNDGHYIPLDAELYSRIESGEFLVS